MVEVRRLRVIGAEVDAGLVSRVEGLFERVASGEVTGIAVVEVMRGGVVATWYDAAGGGYHYLNSGCARLAHRIAGEVDG